MSVINHLNGGINKYITSLQNFTKRSTNLVAAISAIGPHSDPEYLRILQELMKLGIAPSGNKSVDKSKLEQAKIELVQKIQAKQEEEQKQNLKVQPLEAAKESQQASLEAERPGAMNVAELNKIYFGLL